MGIVPGQDFDPSKLEPSVAAGIAKAPKPAQDKIAAWIKESLLAHDATLENGLLARRWELTAPITFNGL
jgi:hypothetical protein